MCWLVGFFEGYCQRSILTSCKYGLVYVRVRNRWWGSAGTRQLDLRQCWFGSDRFLGTVEAMGDEEGENRREGDWVRVPRS